MILRPREGLLASVAVISVTLLSTTPAVVSGAPVVVTDYKQLVGTIGSNDDYATGERFTREGIVLVHKGDACSPDFEGLGLLGFDKHEDMYSLISVDADHADEELLSKLGVDPVTLSEADLCPSLTIIPRRSTVASPAVILPKGDRAGSYHFPAVKTQQVSVGIVNELDFPLEIHYQWWNEPAKPTHIKKLDPGTENWMLSYKTTVVLALNKETREEVGRFLVKGDGLFTVADRACNAETCGTSEGEETPVSV
ncbi:unnamed protein product, partial [Hapterophycus canaliculatus]